MGALFSCTEKQKYERNWKRFYRKTVDDNPEFSRVTGIQQALWFMILLFTGIIGQLLFRLYFNYWNLQLIWLYIPIFWIPMISIFPAIFIMMGCFWAMPIYDVISNGLPVPIKWVLGPLFKLLFWPFLSPKYYTPLDISNYPYNVGYVKDKISECKKYDEKRRKGGKKKKRKGEKKYKKLGCHKWDWKNKELEYKNSKIEFQKKFGHLKK